MSGIQTNVEDDKNISHLDNSPDRLGQISPKSECVTSSSSTLDVVAENITNRHTLELTDLSRNDLVENDQHKGSGDLKLPTEMDHLKPEDDSTKLTKIAIDNELDEDMLLRWDDDDDGDNVSNVNIDKSSAPSAENEKSIKETSTDDVLKKHENITNINVAEVKESDIELANQPDKDIDCSVSYSIEETNLENVLDNEALIHEEYNIEQNNVIKIDNIENTLNKDISQVVSTDNIVPVLDTDTTIENAKESEIIEFNINTGDDLSKADVCLDNVLDTSLQSAVVEIETCEKDTTDLKPLSKDPDFVLVSSSNIPKESLVSTIKEEEITENKEEEEAEVGIDINVNTFVDNTDVHNENNDLNITTENVATHMSLANTSDDSIIEANTKHGLNRPDMMLEIPTQELIDIDDNDVTVNFDDDTKMDVDEIQEDSKDCVVTSIEENISDITAQIPCVEESIKDILTTPDLCDQELDTNINENVELIAQEIKKQDSDLLVSDQINDPPIIVTKKQEESLKIRTPQEISKEFDQGVINKAKAISNEDNNTEQLSLLPISIDQPSSSNISRVSDIIVPIVEASTSKALPELSQDNSNEVPESNDSLGLLAESSRVRDDDEEAEDDEDGDEDDDFDPDDESSNQMTAEHSEDSNPDNVKDPESKPPVAIERNFEFSETNADETEDLLDKDADMDGVGYEEVDIPIQIDEPQLITEDIELPAEKVVEGALSVQEIQKKDVVEEVKSADSTGNEVETDSKQKTDDTILKKILIGSTSDYCSNDANTEVTQTRSKTRNLELMKSKQHIVNIVDLGESSSEEDLQEVIKDTPAETKEPPEVEAMEAEDATTTEVNIPKEIDIMSASAGNTSQIVTNDKEVIISGVPKPPPHKPARLNTSEVSIKTANNTTELTSKIPDTNSTEVPSPKFLLEVFNLDSDEETSTDKFPEPVPSSAQTGVESKTGKKTRKCINNSCPGDVTVYLRADPATLAFYDAASKKRAAVCETCYDAVRQREKSLVIGIKDMTPLLELDMGNPSQELVEISDSDSEEDTPLPEEPAETIGEATAKLLEENLEAIINESWKKYKMDDRLKETQDVLHEELKKLEKDSKEIDDLLNECQLATDKLRNELYATFEGERKTLPSIIIYDTEAFSYTVAEADIENNIYPELMQTSKRRMSSGGAETPAKKIAIPLGYAPLAQNVQAQPAPDMVVKPMNDEPKVQTPVEVPPKIDDDKDVSVVRLSAEAAPPDLPPAGELVRAPLRVGMTVYAMRNAFGSWLRAKVTDCQPKASNPMLQFTMCRVKFEHKVKNPCKVLPARCLAYSEPAEVRMTIGTRVIALFKDSANTGKKESYYSGVVAEVPNPVNNFRYLVFFDDGYAQYVRHGAARAVCESAAPVWDEVHPFSREFVREYLLAYPERPMVRLHPSQSLKIEWNGKWWMCRVIQVDASLAQVHFEDDERTEWIYRGSTRLAPLYLELHAAGKHQQRARHLPRTKAQLRTNMPYVEYTRSDEQANKSIDNLATQQQQNEEIRRQRAVAKKSTAAPPAPVSIPGGADTVTSRVVYYTPKSAVKPYKMVAHTCGPRCRRTDVLALSDLRTYNPLAKPLLSGWERQIVRYKGHKEVMYRAPCGRRTRNMRELHRYLQLIRSDMPVDLFDFNPGTHCLAEFVLNKYIIGKKDLSHGKENVPVPCVNYYDRTLPEFCSYNTERTPTAGVPLNLDPEFLCGCDCVDDCQDKTKCACWKMTLEGARTIGLKGTNVGYVYKRLPEPLPSGIYECNSRCRCKQTCLNRVAQHPLQLKLQVFKTLNRGWGIRALNDVPKGSFLCVYAGNLLTDATANLDGLNEGDEYLAELDYIEVVEQMKEGYEEDIPETDKALDKGGKKKKDEEEEDDEESQSEEEETPDKCDEEDVDFRPGYIETSIVEFSKRLRRREKSNKDAQETEKVKDQPKEQKDNDDDCITISDDEEVREPSRFAAQAGMGANEFISKYRSVRSLFGEDEACYIMDAKVQGNIGRYLNHSCCPNVFVQNVFVDTHDPRFPWVAFFALAHVKAGTELTWNYNYDVGSVPGKVLYCHCGAPNCRGRLL